LYNVRFTEIHK